MMDTTIRNLTNVASHSCASRMTFGVGWSV